MARRPVGDFHIAISAGADARAGTYAVQAAGPKDIKVSGSSFIWSPTAEQQATIEAIHNDVPVSPEDLVDLGGALYSSLFVPQIAEAFGRAKQAVGEGKPLRVRLCVDVPEIASLPWEAMHDGRDYLAARTTDILLVRTLKAAPQQKTLYIRGPLRILFVGASPQDQEPLYLEETTSQLVKLLREASAKSSKQASREESRREAARAGHQTQRLSKRVVFTQLQNASIEDLRRVLQDDYHVVCIAAHGSDDRILLDDGNGVTDDGTGQRGPGWSQRVPADDLAVALEGRKSVRLVFLAACRTASAKRAGRPVLSFVDELARRTNLPAAVAMQTSIGNEQANQLTAHFLTGLSKYRPVDVALAQARRPLPSAEAVAQDLIAPVLYLQSASAALFRPRRRSLWAAAFAVALLLAVFLCAMLTETTRDRERQAMLNLSMGAADQAKHDVLEYPQRSLLMGIEAVDYYAWKAGETGNSDALQALRYVLDRTGGLALAGHYDSITAIAIGPDSRWLVTGDASGGAFVWDLDAADPRTTRTQLADHHGQLTAALFSPDGRLLVTGSADSIYGSGRIRVWTVGEDGLSDSPVFVSPRGAGIYAAAISPDSRWLATSDADNTVKLWNLQDLGVPSSTLVARAGVIKSIAFSGDGRWLAAANRNWRTYLWRLDDTAPTDPPLVLRGHNDWVNAVAFSADSEWLFTGSGQWMVWPPTVTGAAAQDNSIVAWDLTAENPAEAGALLGRPDSPVVYLATSDNYVWLLSMGLTQGSALLWRAGLNHSVVSQQPMVLPDSAGPIAFGPYSFWVVIGDKVWDVYEPSDDYGTYVELHGQEGGIRTAAFSANGRWLVTGGDDGLPRLWDVRRIWLTREASADPLDLVTPLGWYHQADFSSDGQWLATNFAPESIREDSVLYSGQDVSYPVFLWDRDDPSTELRPLFLFGHQASVELLAFSGDGRWLATADRSGGIILWDPTDLDAGPMNVAGSGSSVQALAMSDDGRWLAALGDRTATMRLWDLSQAPKSMPPPVEFHEHTESINSMAFSPDGHWLLTGTDDNTARLWNLASAAPAENPLVLAGHRGDVRRVLVTADGKWAVTSSYDRTVMLWDLQSADPSSTARSFAGYGTSVEVMSASPDAHWLATADDSDMVLWDLWHLNADARVLTGHTAEVTSVDISPDSRWLATGDYDGRLLIWDLDDLGGSPATFEGPEGAIEIVRFSGDGRYILTAFNYGTVTLQLVRADDLIELACEVAGRNFDVPEWQLHFSSRPYRLACPGQPLPRSSVEPLLEEAKTLAEEGDVAGATAKYQEAKELAPTLNLDPGAESELIAAGASIDSLVKQNRLQDALDSYLAVRLGEGLPELAMDTVVALCVYGSYVSPLQTEEICSEGVRMDDVPTHGVRAMGFALFGRGVSRMANHDLPGAAADFRSIPASLTGFEGYDQFRAELGVDLDAWVAALEAGHVPADAYAPRSYELPELAEP